MLGSMNIGDLILFNKILVGNNQIAKSLKYGFKDF